MINTIYDPKQLQTDLALIVSEFGERGLHGYNTQGRCRRGSVTIIDSYSADCEITIMREAIDLRTLVANSWCGHLIMQMAMTAEEKRDCRYND